MKLLKAIKEFRWGYVLLFFVTAGIAACFFAYNNRSLDALAIAIGVLLILGAVLIAVYALAAKERGFSFALKILFAVIALIAGVTTLIARADTINAIVSVLGLIMVIDGSFKFHTTAMSKRYKTWAWVVLLVLSVLLIAGGYVTIRYLTVEQAVTVYLLGALLALDALANLFTAFCLAAYERGQRREIRAEILGEQTAEVPAEAPAEAPVEAPVEEAVEAPAEAPAEEATEIPAEAPAEAPVEVPAEEATEVPAEEAVEAPAEAPAEEVDETPTETGDDVPRRHDDTEG